MAVFSFTVSTPATAPSSAATGAAAADAVTALQLIGEVFEADEPDAGGELALPGWLRIYCPTAERSVQTGPATLRTGLAAHAARAYSADGSTWGLLVEPAAENIVADLEYGTWGGAATVNTATAPDGTAALDIEVEDTSAISQQNVLKSFNLESGEDYTISGWHQVLAPAPTTSSSAQMDGFASTLNLDITTGVEAAWSYQIGDTQTANASSGNCYLIPRWVTSADLGATRYYGIQVEKRSYATSWMGGDGATYSREADTLLAAAESIAPGGFFDLELVFAPQYASDETTADHNLVWFDADNRLFFRQSDAKLVLEIGGEELASSALTFARGDVLTIRAAHLEAGRGIIVSGASVGDGTTEGDALEAISLPLVAFVLGASSGAEEGAVLYAMRPQLLTFEQHADTRALAQMDDSVGNRRFRELLRALAYQSGRFWDVCRTVKAALELSTAVGAQLDAIGAVVGLAREGFTDDRYRVFLGIQVELLLAAARDDAEWTGTCPNILRICRTFAGPDAAQIVLTNSPPYTYAVQVPDLDLAEAFLLARFLTVANYAAVNGMLIAVLDVDAIWDSNVTPISGALVWDSNVTPLANGSIWGIVVFTS